MFFGTESSIDESMDKPGRCGCCHRWWMSTGDRDRRLVGSYRSYIVGRWLALIGSGLLLFALVLKFFLLDKKGPVDICALVLIIISLAQVGLGALLIFWSAHKARTAQVQFAKEQSQRPASSVSNGSFGSTASSTAYLTGSADRNRTSAMSSVLHAEPPVASINNDIEYQ